MCEYVFRNESTYIRAIKDAEHPYTMVPAYFNDPNLYDGYERAILLELSSNRNDFIIVKTVIEKRLGFGRRNFNKAWKSLENKRHIFSERIRGGWKHVYSEVGKYGEEDSAYRNMESVEPSQLLDNESYRNVQSVNMESVENMEKSMPSQLLDNESYRNVHCAKQHSVNMDGKQVLNKMSIKEERPEILKGDKDGSKPGFVINDNFFSSGKDLTEDLGCNFNTKENPY